MAEYEKHGYPLRPSDTSPKWDIETVYDYPI